MLGDFRRLCGRFKRVNVLFNAPLPSRDLKPDGYCPRGSGQAVGTERRSLAENRRRAKIP